VRDQRLRCRARFVQQLTDFYDAYAEKDAVFCDHVLTGTLAGVTLALGVYCFDAAATLTGQLTLAALPPQPGFSKLVPAEQATNVACKVGSDMVAASAATMSRCKPVRH
jgi:hypothetical protein